MKVIIVDNRISPACERYLLKEGYFLIKLAADPDLGEAVASHPDTLLFYSDRQIITTADYCDAAAYIFSDIREFAPDVRVSFTADRRKKDYPHDCIMNALVIGNKIFCKEDSISEAIKDYAKDKGYSVVNTKQGYPACNVLHFGNSAITADRGLSQLLSENGIKVSLIRPGHISLTPYEYGFIGGASGVVGNKVYFFGDLSTHPDCEIIRKAVIDEGYVPISLSDENLADLGGIIAL